MTTYDFISALTALTGHDATAFVGPTALARLAQDGSGNLSIAHWDASLGVEPTVAQLVAAATAPALTQALLTAYASSKAATVIATPRHYTEGGVTLLIDATQGTRTDIGDLAEWGAANPTALTPWIDNAGDVTSAPGSFFVSVARLVGLYNLSVFAVLAPIITGIKAGAITTAAEIDALFTPAASL